jgi:hypothetical protein
MYVLVDLAAAAAAVIVVVLLLLVNSLCPEHST